VSDLRVPFNRVDVSGHEREYLADAIATRELGTLGPYTLQVRDRLEQALAGPRVLVTHSCTAALEMAAILADLGPGDEVVMPSFTFAATANAAVLRGATPVFVDIRADTLNIDEGMVASAVGERTKAIVAVHYAGVACDLDALAETAGASGALLVEDAAQGILATYRGRPLGTFGALAALSFHETKNVTAGKGGALLVNDDSLVERAELVYAHGTNQLAFLRGDVARYSWQDTGSAFAIAELNAAVLAAQLERAAAITDRRTEIWEAYHAALSDLEQQERIRRPVVPPECRHNGHLYYILLPDASRRAAFIGDLRRSGVEATFHYVPLHDAPAGRRFGRVHGDLSLTVDLAARIVRLPLWPEMNETDVEVVVAAVRKALA
jgi:dTDP-4-amino-4,6-dideoxygalactose transaminase